MIKLILSLLLFVCLFAYKIKEKQSDGQLTAYSPRNPGKSGGGGLCVCVCVGILFMMICFSRKRREFFSLLFKKRLARRVNVFNLWAKHRASLKSKRELSLAVLNFNFNTDIIVVVVFVVVG